MSPRYGIRRKVILRIVVAGLTVPAAVESIVLSSRPISASLLPAAAGPGHALLPMRARARRARWVIAVQLPARTSVSGVSQEPPTAPTLGTASHHAACSCLIPP